MSSSDAGARLDAGNAPDAALGLDAAAPDAAPMMGSDAGTKFSCPAPLPTTSLAGKTVPLLEVGGQGPFPTPKDALACLPTATGTAAPFVMNLGAGTFGTFGIFSGHDGFTLTGAGAGRTIIDGQGGCPTNNNDSSGTCTTRLVYGKGAIYTQSAGTISDLTVTRGGNNAGGHGDGQAGIYAESFAASGELVLLRIYVYQNQNGFFAPGGTNGGNVHLTVDHCDFVENGQGGGGYSHDMYVQGASLTIRESNFYGNPFGNNVKSRSPLVDITGGYNANNAGRTVNFPEGGQVTIRGGTYTSVAGANANFASYADENTNQGVMRVSWTGSTIVFSRFNSTFLLPNGGGFDFSQVTEAFANPNGTAPSVVVVGSGTVTGLADLSLPAGGQYVAVPAPPAHASGAP